MSASYPPCILAGKPPFRGRAGWQGSDGPAGTCEWGSLPLPVLSSNKTRMSALYFLPSGSFPDDKPHWYVTQWKSFRAIFMCV